MAGVQSLRVRRGDVWSVDLDPTVANEQHGIRPCLVISSDRFNLLPIRQAFVVPLTTRDRGFPHHIALQDDGGLNRPSWAMCEAARAVSTQRFGRYVGTASAACVDRVAWQLTSWLGDQP